MNNTDVLSTSSDRALFFFDWCGPEVYIPGKHVAIARFNGDNYGNDVDVYCLPSESGLHSYKVKVMSGQDVSGVVTKAYILAFTADHVTDNQLGVLVSGDSGMAILAYRVASAITRKRFEVLDPLDHNNKYDDPSDLDVYENKYLLKVEEIAYAENANRTRLINIENHENRGNR